MKDVRFGVLGFGALFVQDSLPSALGYDRVVIGRLNRHPLTRDARLLKGKI
jgi:hypothetical protein